MAVAGRGPGPVFRRRAVGGNEGVEAAADHEARLLQQYVAHGPHLATGDPNSDLHRRDVDACCHIRKVLPLDRALEGFDAWITGRKRFQGGDRLRLKVVEEAGPHLKFNPLANWTKDDVDAYAAEHDLPAHPLVAQGYPSIGCWPCTNPVEEGQDVRAGRWAGQDKTECGIHIARAPGVPSNVGGDI